MDKTPKVERGAKASPVKVTNADGFQTRKPRQIEESKIQGL